MPVFQYCIFKEYASLKKGKLPRKQQMKTFKPQSLIGCLPLNLNLTN